MSSLTFIAEYCINDVDLPLIKAANILFKCNVLLYITDIIICYKHYESQK